MKIYFAAWLFDKSLGQSLTKKRANVRLLSYYFIKEGKTTNEQLEKYVVTGRLNISKK